MGRLIVLAGEVELSINKREKHNHSKLQYRRLVQQEAEIYPAFSILFASIKAFDVDSIVIENR